MAYPKRVAPLSLLALFLISAGCDDEETVIEPPTGLVSRAELVGEYLATTLELTIDDVTEDVLARPGAELRLVLAADAQSTGRLFIPGGGEDGGDLDASMNGAWSFNLIAQTVTLVQDADTFVRDMTFRAVRDEGDVLLESEDTFGPGTIAVVLLLQQAPLF